jgi:pimeloyl-ACP methyl ester carboxylesterase
MASANALPQSQLRGLVLGGYTFNFFGPHVFPYVAKGAFLRALAALLGEQRLINRQMPKELGPSRLDLDPVDARALMEGGLSVTVFAQAVKALRRIDFRAKLAAIEQPVLIVNGDRDKVHIEQEASFLSVAQHATSQRFANCEHGVSLWRHAEFAELVNAFAARVFARDAAALAVLSGTSV